MADISLEKTLPNNMEAERSILGAILLDDKAVLTVFETLRSQDFYLESHRRVFEKMIQLAVLFFNEWLRKSKYKMADLYWFERFAELPAPKGYTAAEREFYFPIKPT